MTICNTCPPLNQGTSDERGDMQIFLFQDTAVGAPGSPRELPLITSGIQLNVTVERISTSIPTGDYLLPAYSWRENPAGPVDLSVTITPN